MQLKELLKDIPYQLVKGNLEVEIKDICYDSRDYQKKDVFVCLVGIDTDGHKYIEDVIKRGCQVIITSKEVDVNDNDITVIRVDDTRRKLPYLSANLFHHPADKLIKIAITGTKGKTSTSWMIKNILESAQEKVGVIGTIGTIIDGKITSHKNTTPESYLVQKYMRKMVNAGVKYLIMEASSQALWVGRIQNIVFDYGIFTNLSIDHVGPREHASYEDYANSKALLFKQCKVGIFNQDDMEFTRMTKEATCEILTYGKKKKNNLMIKEVSPIHENDFLGTKLQTEGVIQDDFLISSPGDFSAYNAAAAILLANTLKINIRYIKEGLQTFQVPGRLQIFNINNRFKVVIDFAHNKLSMESVIQTMRKYRVNRIITLFGCGGGRSYDRRVELGCISGKLADLSIITTDNPRWDDVHLINADIKKGIESVGGKYLIIEDRKEAILYALNHAKERDVILLLGKGHENFQEIKGIKYDFNETEIIKTYLKGEKENDESIKLSKL